MDRVFAIHAGNRGFDCNRRHMSECFFRSNRPRYSHRVCAELENSGIRVAVGDYSVTERRRWRPPYQTGKTVQVHAKIQRGRTHVARYARPWSIPLSHSVNVITRTGLKQQQLELLYRFCCSNYYDRLRPN